MVIKPMFRQQTSLLIWLSILCCNSTAFSAEVTEKPASIDSPVDWALGYFQKSFGEGTHITRMQIDLDHDGTDELFIGWNAARGRNGMPFLVFQKYESGYLFLGELFMRADLRGFKVLPRTTDGKINFAQYWAHGGCEGTIAFSTHDGTRFQTLKSEKVCAGDSKRYSVTRLPNWCRQSGYSTRHTSETA